MASFILPALTAKQQMVEMLAKQVASPVQFVKGLETLYQAGARVFVETGPKKALQGFAEDVLGECGDVLSLFTNHPKFGDIVAFNQALCGLYSAGLGSGQVEAGHEITASAERAQPAPSTPAANTQPPPPVAPTNARNPEPGFAAKSTKPSIVITGAALGLPGTERIFDDANIGRILQGEQFIDVIPTRIRRAMLDKHITRLVKSDNGGAFETISSLDDVIKLAGRGGAFDVDEPNSESLPSARPPSTALPRWRSPPELMPCVTPAFLSSCITRPRVKVRSCRMAGGCRMLCATTPG